MNKHSQVFGDLHTRKCSSLKKDEGVVFFIYSDIYKKKKSEHGSVVFVDEEAQTVCVSWMEGYKEHHDDIPFEDMLGVFNPDAPVMKFENISGKSDLLIPE